MSFLFKKFFFTIIFNTTLFLVLFIGIQNTSKKAKVNLLINESINLPVGFIIGTSFIFGSLTGNLISLNLNFKKNQ